MGIGVFRRQLDRCFERRLDLSANALRERLGNRYPLRVAAQRVSLPVVRIGVLGLIALQPLGPHRNFLE